MIRLESVAMVATLTRGTPITTQNLIVVEPRRSKRLMSETVWVNRHIPMGQATILFKQPRIINTIRMKIGREIAPITPLTDLLGNSLEISRGVVIVIIIIISDNGRE